MIAIARAVSNGEFAAGGGADPAQTIAALCAIRVSARGRPIHYIAMRALAWPGRLAAAGRGAAQCHELCPTPQRGQREADAIAEAWRPWRSYAVLHTWRRLEKPAAETSKEPQS